MKNYKVYQLILILTPFVFSFALGLDIYIPIVPQMTGIFHTTPGLVQLTLSIFLFTTGAGQLFVGPLSDQFGRRPIFFISSVFFALGSFACAYCQDIWWLIACRFISALGACGMIVTGFAMVRDLFCGKRSAKIYSFLNGSIGISPTFAPIVGGYLALFWGWESVFYCLAIVGLLAFFITKFTVSETHPQELRVKVNAEVFGRYKTIFLNHQFLVFASIAGFAQSVFFSFFSISPILIIDHLNIPTHEFGYYFACFGAVIGLGGFLGGKIVEKVGIPRTVVLGISCLFVGSISMFIWHYFAALTLSGFIIPMVVACTGAMFLVGASASKALEPFGEIAGTASAAFGSLEFGLASIIGSVLMLFPITTTIPYAICIVLMAIFSLFALSLAPKAGKALIN